MSVDTKPFALDVDALSPTINRRAINSALKDEEALNATFIGQERAREALTFGLGINTKGYNLYVMGEPATGRFTLVKDYIERQVSQLSAPDDWCYINNFEEEREPVALKFPPGGGKAFHKDMAALIDDVLDSLPIAFDNPGYQRRRASISREFEQKYDAAIDAVERYAQANDVALYEEGGSITFSPIINGKPISDTEFASFTDEQRKGFYILIDELENRLSESLLSLPTWKRENSERLRELDKKTAEQGIKPLIKVLEHKYASELGVMKYLKQLKNALVSAILVIHGEEQKEEKSDDFDKKVFLEEQFLPNVLVSNKLDDAAPVIYEPNPTYQNLFGKIEYTNVHGSVFTNYRMIQPGALHRANGGYLLLDVDQLIEQPFVWDTLKLAIKSQRLRMDLPQQDVGMVNNITLNPQPIDLNVKIVLLGSRDLYYTLQDYDDEFDELFRVLVDFDLEIPVTRQALFDFVGKVRAHLIHLGLKGITVNAMCRLVEYSLRMAEHKEKLSAHFAEVIELVNEAYYFCQKSNADTLELDHLKTALSAKKRRTGRVSQTLLNDIKEGHVLIATEGKAVGKVNGLTVLDIGDTAFGTPARITSTVFAGASGVVDIEREVELGQPIHSKGVMLLNGYLGNKYAQHFPLTLSANIALEQSYGHIDGDSASLGELVALISALTEIPCLQTLAITGSINQYGEVQAVGGVNEKIEGFFDLCQHRGLTGTQGVIIPKSNAINLVLDTTVIDAVKKGLFHIYTVETVDDALTILMEQEAGKISSKGRYPKNSINYHAVNRLYNIALIVNGGDGE
ncbi:Lon protease family protein [Alteromonas mediterranea]|uniref:endopeptidase La n=1 Tax=Alteromonas mediterranea TaxID=314275 RepID=A0AAC9F754_9ALTE|nr:AAA family ATPase [Alteromonas mediterranea]AFV85467.1 putative ATP-dependent protease [Alteromonas mediterranea DE1]AGP97479.1 ATP-dependent protease [Alteromonas mediterranea UM7]AGQ01751.1 ATP-dependent protease [Alteromonas mediterranea UM4b]AMJ78546.1 ATP-dependent protease [Alteromonas mediterranea]AMJ82696.1 ATP-dependent protease [Alteromonas mediterranea]